MPLVWFLHTRAVASAARWEREQYRVGFNGMEKDDELTGAGHSYDFGVGRWLSVNPLAQKKRWFSPCNNFVQNNPENEVGENSKKLINNKYYLGHCVCVRAPQIKTAIFPLKK